MPWGRHPEAGLDGRGYPAQMILGAFCHIYLVACRLEQPCQLQGYRGASAGNQNTPGFSTQ